MDNRPAQLNLLQDFNILENVYDSIRLLDPVEKKVHYYIKPDEIKHVPVQDPCFSFWDNNSACQNCITARAISQNKPFMKFEYYNHKIYMVTAVPLVLEGKMVAVELIKDISNSGIVSVEGQEISELKKFIDRKNKSIIYDAITRIYNEEFIAERLPYNIYLANQENKNLSLIYASIMNLKAINEKIGMDAGDHTIKEFAKIMRRYCRDKEDWCSRYGGTGFVLLRNDTDEKQVYQICKRLNDKIEKTDFIFKDATLKVEIRIGSYTILNQAITPNSFIKQAANTIYAGSTNKPINQTDSHEQSRDGFLLTAREKEIAQLVLKGWSNNDICQHLFISIPTVKKHISAIYAKYHVKSRAEFITANINIDG